MAQIDEDIRDDSDPTAGRSDRRGRKWLPIPGRGWLYAVALAVMSALDAVVYAFIKRHGVSNTGDEPHYLVVARAISHLTVHPLQAYATDLRTHQLFAWPAGTRLTNLDLQLYTGPHGQVSDHPIGLSVLLAPFVAAGGARLARLALMVLGCAGFIYLFQRAGRLAGLGPRGRVALAAVLCAPGVWLAATQIYPDFLTGVLLACALVEVVTMELDGDVGFAGMTVAAVSLAFLPWLHQQNLVAAAFGAAAFLVIAWRRRGGHGETAARPKALVIAGVSVASWVLLLVFNLYEYGHLLGLPQPFPSLNWAGSTEILGLLFDRHQGLFVQFPIMAVVALVGMWMARRTAPIGLAATVLGAASLIYLNGTFFHAPYGGLSFAGRFEWSSLVPMLVWAPFAVAALDRVGRRVWVLVAASLGVWILQAVPILAGHHVYYNQQQAPDSPWDPAGYPGWWSPINRVFPVLEPTGLHFGSPWFALPLTVVIVVVGIAVVAAGTRPGKRWMLAAAPAVLLTVAGVGTVAAVGPLGLPDRSLIFRGHDVGTPLVTTSSGASVSVPLSGVSKGTFVVAVSYHAAGVPGSSVGAFCRPRSNGVLTWSVVGINPGGGVASAHISCPAGTIGFGATVQPNTTISIGSVRLTKVSNS